MERKLTEQEIISRFNNAVKSDSVYIYYQPQYNQTTKKIVGAEALIRWNDKECGIQSPGDFIPVLEKTGLVYTADVEVFERTCDFLRKQMNEKANVVPISVNSSRSNMYSHDYVNEIESIRKDYKIPVEMLRIEITESSAAGDTDTMIDFLEELHSCGYIVEMDDFGSGYSSLSMLKDINVDMIKLDMHFFAEESDEISARSSVIINSILRMAECLDTPVIAEGIETEKQAKYMEENGCHLVQGYYYSMPISELEFKKKLVLAA